MSVCSNHSSPGDRIVFLSAPHSYGQVWTLCPMGKEGGLQTGVILEEDINLAGD